MNTEAFKTCPNCKHVWLTLESFLNDPALELAGYQVHFDNLEGGLFLFSHNTPECYTTLAIQVTQFKCLTDMPIVAKRTQQPDKCSKTCVRKGELGDCPVKCECNWVRDILQKIKDWEKEA